MKIIVATKETQGRCAGDFNFAEEGEVASNRTYVYGSRRIEAVHMTDGQGQNVRRRGRSSPARFGSILGGIAANEKRFELPAFKIFATGPARRLSGQGYGATRINRSIHPENQYQWNFQGGLQNH